MTPMVIGWIVLACSFGGALAGMYLRAKLPEDHLNTETRDLVKLGMGLVATMAALVLGLLIASAKSSYDTRKSEVVESSATSDARVSPISMIRLSAWAWTER